jgi:hypothetical protein
MPVVEKPLLFGRRPDRPLPMRGDGENEQRRAAGEAGSPSSLLHGRKRQAVD